MNPPSLPPTKSSPAHYCAWCSIAAPLALFCLALLAHALFSPLPPPMAMVLGLVFLVFIITGLVTGIIALCGISEYGKRGLLVQGIIGLVLNIGLVIFVGSIAVKSALHRQAAAREFTQNMRADSQQMQADVKKSYNSDTGITNMNSKSIDKIQGDMDKAAQTLTGDDALISQAMSHYLTHVRSNMEKYEAAVAQLKGAQILVTSNLTDKAEILSRREIVQNFIAANDELKKFTLNSETFIRADMNSMNIPPAKIDTTITGFDSKFLPRRDLTVKIRNCDDQMGESMLSVLDLLEADWGRWRYDKVSHKIYFDRPTARQSYQESLKSIQLAGQQQIALQGELVNLP